MLDVSHIESDRNTSPEPKYITTKYLERKYVPPKKIIMDKEGPKPILK